MFSFIRMSLGQRDKPPPENGMRGTPSEDCPRRRKKRTQRLKKRDDIPFSMGHHPINHIFRSMCINNISFASVGSALLPLRSSLRGSSRRAKTARAAAGGGPRARRR